MTALALRDDQTQWDNQQLAVLHQTGIDQDVTEPELMAFLHECQRRKLDPFSRQIYLIGRTDKRKGRKVYKSQTSIDGFRLIARRAADKSGIEYSYEDTIWYDADGGRHDIWLSQDAPAGAKVVVIRNGSRFDAVARFGAYVQTDYNGNASGQWRSMADVMIAKCAEALALRKAFPEDLGGIYTEEEMAQADNPQRVTATAEVVREEPAQQNGSDPWYVRPAPEAEAAEKWVTAALRVIPDIGLEACRKLWREAAGKHRAGELTDDEAKSVLDPLKARMEALATPAQDAGASASAEGASPVAAALDPDDEWAAKVADLSDEDEANAALEELAELVGSGAMGAERFAAILEAIQARFPQAGTAREKAA